MPPKRKDKAKGKKAAKSRRVIHKAPSPVTPLPPLPQVDPLLEPLIASVFEISKRLELLRKLVEFKVVEIEEMYKNTKLVGRKSAASLLGMSASQFDRQVRDGKLASVFINRRTRVSLGDLEKYVEARRGAGRSKSSPGKKTKTQPSDTSGDKSSKAKS